MPVPIARVTGAPGRLPHLRSIIVTKDRQHVATTGSVWEVRTSPDGGSLLRWKWEQFRGRTGQAGLDERFDVAFEPWLRRFEGTLADRPEPDAVGMLPFIPGVAPHVPILPLDLGGIGLCARDVVTDGLCSLAPPLTCYTCPSLAAFRDGPHGIIGDALERQIDTRMDGAADRRIPLQLADTVAAIRQLQAQIRRENGDRYGAEAVVL